MLTALWWFGCKMEQKKNQCEDLVTGYHAFKNLKSGLCSLLVALLRTLFCSSLWLERSGAAPRVERALCVRPPSTWLMILPEQKLAGTSLKTISQNSLQHVAVRCVLERKGEIVGSAEIPSSPALAASGSCEDADTLWAGFGRDFWGAQDTRCREPPGQRSAGGDIRCGGSYAVL